MRKVKIITDSCADIPADLLMRYSIDYALMSTVERGVEFPALLTWTPEEAHELYETIRNGTRITTAQVSVSEFERIFRKYLDRGFDIVYIGCSSKQSGSVNTGFVVSKDLLKEYPDSEIYCIDSLNSSLGEGMLAIEAARMAGDEKSASEINEHILSIRKNVNQFVTVHTLEHLKKAGRVTASAAFFGNLMGVKPILVADVDGVQTAIKKVRGRKASFEEIVSMLSEQITDASDSTVYIAHADCSDEEVSMLTDLVREKIGCRNIITGLIGPIIGASIGPDAVGVWAFGKKVTYRAEAD